jgi:hypothetical protein
VGGDSHVFEWINPALFPPPSKVLEAAIPLIRSGELFGHIGMSLLVCHIRLCHRSGAGHFRWCADRTHSLAAVCE